MLFPCVLAISQTAEFLSTVFLENFRSRFTGQTLRLQTDEKQAFFRLLPDRERSPLAAAPPAKKRPMTTTSLHMRTCCAPGRRAVHRTASGPRSQQPRTQKNVRLQTTSLHMLHPLRAGTARGPSQAQLAVLVSESGAAPRPFV